MPDAAFCVEKFSFSLMAGDFAFHTIPTAHLHGFTRRVGLLSRLRLGKVEGGELLMPVLCQVRDAKHICLV